MVADNDNFSPGDEEALTCGEVFTNSEVNRLIQLIDEKNQVDFGGPLSYCSKISSDYSFVILSQKFKDPDHYFCVDSNFSVIEIPSENVSISSESRMCNDSLVVDAEEEGDPVPPAITSLVYDTGSSVFNIDYSEEWAPDSCSFLFYMQSLMKMM